VWVGNSFFGADAVAMETSTDFRPYIYSMPNEFMSHQRLFSMLGVPSTPTAGQLANALSAVASDWGTEEALPEDILPVVILLADSLAVAGNQAATQTPPRRSAQHTSTIPTERCYLPDENGVLAPAASLYFDDASWLGREGLKMVHPEVISSCFC
jgi:hypothetical protein